MLIVEDDADVVDLLRYNLSKAGFGVSSPAMVSKDLKLPQRPP